MENVNRIAKRIVETVQLAQEFRRILTDHNMAGGEYSRIIDEIELRVIEKDAKRLAEANKLCKP